MQSLNDLLCRVLAGDRTAADEVDEMASRLHELARHLRSGQQEGINSPGGMSDQVQINLVGPDGTIKHKVDTGKQS